MSDHEDDLSAGQSGSQPEEDEDEEGSECGQSGSQPRTTRRSECESGSQPNAALPN